MGDLIAGAGLLTLAAIYMTPHLLTDCCVTPARYIDHELCQADDCDRHVCRCDDDCAQPGVSQTCTHGAFCDEHSDECGVCVGVAA